MEGLEWRRVTSGNMAAHLGAVGHALFSEWMGGSGEMDARLRLGGAWEDVHSALLSAHSDRDSWDGLHGLDPAALYACLEWLYSGSTSVSIARLPALAAAADALQLPALQRALEDLTLTFAPASPEALVACLDLAYSRSFHAATKVVLLKLALEQLGDLGRVAAFWDLPIAFFFHLLASDDLPVAAETHALQIALKALGAKPSTFRLNLLMDQIRFLSMTPSELRDSARLADATGSATLAAKTKDHVRVAEAFQRQAAETGAAPMTAGLNAQPRRRSCARPPPAARVEEAAVATKSSSGNDVSLAAPSQSISTNADLRSYNSATSVAANPSASSSRNRHRRQAYHPDIRFLRHRSKSAQPASVYGCPSLQRQASVSELDRSKANSASADAPAQRKPSDPCLDPPKTNNTPSTHNTPNPHN